MEVLQQILIMIVTLGVLVAFHEYGHFWVARRCGVKVLRFSIGFGKSLFSWRDRQGTEYCVAAIPLGGYVKMLDEREAPVEEHEKFRAFNNKPVFQRILIVLAGPVANFILAVFVYWLVFLQGVTSLAPVVFTVTKDSIADKAGLEAGVEIISVDGRETSSAQAVSRQLLTRIGTSGQIQMQVKPQVSTEIQSIDLVVERWLSDATESIDPAADLGFGFYRPKVMPEVQSIIKGAAADRAGILKGDRILAVDDSPVDDFQTFVSLVQVKSHQLLRVRLERQGESVLVEMIPDAKKVRGKEVGFVGIQAKVPEVPPHLLKHQSYNGLSAIPPAIKMTWQNMVFSLTSLKKLLMGELSYKQLSSPISIAQIANDSFKVGFFAYLSLLALLSVSLGVLNLLPVPVLDGGHILFYVIEWIKGSPVSDKVQMLAYQAGLILVLGVMLLAIFNDINRLT